MPGSYSKILLQKLNFIEENNKMVKYTKPLGNEQL